MSKLKKELGLLGVFVIGTGSTLSSGLFLLPGLAAQDAGTSIVLIYLIAAIPLIPALMCKTELATAMPRTGGIYFFLDRTIGPLAGTIGGIGTWATLILKVAFVLIGMGAYLRLYFPSLDILPVAIVIAIILTLVNIAGSKKAEKFQIFLVVILLSILVYLITFGITHIDTTHYVDVFEIEFNNLISSAGLVYISYFGLTKVTSVSEEIKKPERNIPLGTFYSFLVSVIIYFFMIYILVGVVPIQKIAGNLTPIADLADHLFGSTGVLIITIAALASFISVANTGLMSASRYPLAMSRDNILPKFFKSLSKSKSPINSLVITSISVVIVLTAFDPLKIAKLASAFQLLLFSFVCLAVIVIRESKIDSYDPGYKTPLYPWIPLIGFLTPFVFIAYMGIQTILVSASLLVIGFLWYWYYAKDKIIRTGAIYHIFERLGKLRFEGLDKELRGILKEKGLRVEDPFDQIVMRAHVIDAEESDDFDSIVKKASKWLSQLTSATEEDLTQQFLDGTRIGATPVTRNVALPHLRVNDIQNSEMVLVRTKKGLRVVIKSALSHYEEEEHKVKALFFLMSPEDKPGQHLRMLAQIAGRVDDANFNKDWNDAKDSQDLKEALIVNERVLSLSIEKDTKSEVLANRMVSDIKLPENSYISLVNKSNVLIQPLERTLIELGDRLSIIGQPEDIKNLRDLYT